MAQVPMRTSSTVIGGVTGSGSRFTLLYLDEDELYIDDCAAFYTSLQTSATASGGVPIYAAASPSRSQVFVNPAVPFSRKLKGRLKVCSGSVIFDPEETKYPLLKFHYTNIQKLGVQPGVSETFFFESDGFTEIKPNEPYRPIKILSKHVFEVRFVSLNDIYLHMSKLHELVTLSAVSSPDTLKDYLKALTMEMEQRLTFDRSWVVNIHERTVMEINAKRVKPLITHPGRLLLTDTRIYFQSMHHIEATPVEHFPLSSVVRVVKRRHQLCHTGLEIFFDDTSIFLDFASTQERNTFHDAVCAQPGATKLVSGELDLGEMTRKWQIGAISNFDYLMYLNFIAGRSFNDLTQYPVFPWIIKDYTSPVLDLSRPETFRDLSKPVGALNPARLAKFRERYDEMPDPKFFYGTHYSTPGYVLYFLVRRVPEYMLRLQNGKFDNPDRLFASIAETWQSCLTNPTDVKELIPEFYMCGDFLLNNKNLDLGLRSNYTRVHDVILPPWAKGTDNFVEQLKQALESEYVSMNLHKWIDLIFGYKQRGQPSIEADNVFYHLTYEGAIDMQAVTDPLQRKGLEAQIREFGQTPSQIFHTPHPQRFTAVNSTSLSNVLHTGTASVQQLPQSPTPPRVASPPERLPSPLTSSEASASTYSAAAESADLSSSDEEEEASQSVWKETAKLKYSSLLKLHRDSVTACCLSRDGHTLCSVSQDSSVKIYNLHDKRQMRMNNLNLALSSCQITSNDKAIAIGSWDNKIYMYSVDCGRVSDYLCAHDDAVSCLCMRGDVLLSGSWDTSVKVWQCNNSSFHKSALHEFARNDSAVRCVSANAHATIAVSGSEDGTLVFYDTRIPNGVIHRSRKETKLNAILASLPDPMQAHTEAINGLQMSADGTHVLSGSQDGDLKLFDSTGCEVTSVNVGEPIKCLVTDFSTAIVGTATGVFLWDLKELVVATLPIGGPGVGEITSLATTSNASTVVAGSSNGAVCYWRYQE
ncbi:protein FAN [Pelomyxa schiedti]|nr:protein FAN [Pelomyxa schiedti]